MPAHETILNNQEKEWIMKQRVTRLTDNKEIQIYPMGAEKYLSHALFASQMKSYNIRTDIENKHVLVIPGHGNSSFLFAQAGAKSITIYDKDPVTIAWIKAFKKYYHYRECVGSTSYPSIGELLTALTSWYPPLVSLPFGKISNMLFWSLHPDSLRRVYIHYMLSLIKQAVQSNVKHDFELQKNIQFHVGTIDDIKISKKQIFDTAFIPYLLGVQNGIESEEDIVNSINKLITLIPNARIIITPSQNTKEFYITGKRYFVTTPYPSIQSIPKLNPFIINVNKRWFRKLGLVVLGSP